ncbi:MAG: cytidine/deoxycytidylate deaminase family protein [Candidatus Kerfeldbacteria bacterium]
MSKTSQTIRPSWDDYFMSIARIVATRATCDRLFAGAVLVKDKRIVSTGYNGAPPALEHCDDIGHLLEDGHCVRTIHAEHNALLQAAVVGGTSTKGTTLYALYSPCIHCAKYVVAAGVERIVVGKNYRNKTVIEYLKDAGVQYDHYEPSEGWNGHVSEMFTKDIDERDGDAVQLNTA